MVFSFFSNTIRPRHESDDHFSLALLYLSPFSLAPLECPLSHVVTRNSNEKKIRWRGEWTDRRTKDWSEEVMTDGMGIPAHVPEECKGNDGPRCRPSARATHLVAITCKA